MPARLNGWHAREITSGSVQCDAGHRFPIQAGVPRLLPASALDASATRRDARTKTALAIADSFDGEWKQFDYDTNRTWHETVEDRCKL